MREVVVFQVGQCGIQMGCEFWNDLCQEHSINQVGQSTPNMPLEKAHSFFNEAGENKFVPRAILTDMERSTSDSISSSAMGGLFGSDSFVSGTEGSRGLFSSGYYVEGSEQVEEVMDAARKQIDACDRFSGFMTFHALSGGTGSGLTLKIIEKLREEYPDRIIKTISLYNSKSHPECDLGIYNEVLGANWLVENCDLVNVFDNDALNNIARRLDKKPYSTFNDTNKLISTFATGVTTGTRFSGMLNSDFRNMATNLVPFVRLHFFLPSISPLLPLTQKHKPELKIQKLAQNLLDESAVLSTCNPLAGKSLSVSAQFRGTLSQKEAEFELFNQANKHSSNFAEWIPSNFHIRYCNTPSKDAPISVTFMNNSTAIAGKLRESRDRYEKMLRKKKYLHYYLQDGMDEMEFQEVHSNTNDLITEIEIYGGNLMEDEFEEFD